MKLMVSIVFFAALCEVGLYIYSVISWQAERVHFNRKGLTELKEKNSIHYGSQSSKRWYHSASQTIENDFRRQLQFGVELSCGRPRDFVFRPVYKYLIIFMIRHTVGSSPIPSGCAIDSISFFPSGEIHGTGWKSRTLEMLRLKISFNCKLPWEGHLLR